MREKGSAVWGGATLGLVVGLALGFFVGSYWTTVLYAVLIGAASGVVANILGWLSDRGRSRAAAASPTAGHHMRSLLLNQAEVVLSQCTPVDFETTQNAASMSVATVSNLVGMEAWSASYDSLDSFYAAHEASHPDIRIYTVVWDEIADDDDLDQNDPPNGTGELIAQRIAAHRAQQG
jgi:hypothetical protein